MRLHAKGDRVTQPQYGPGTVTEVDGNHTVIDFDEHGVRRFVTNLVQLEPTSVPAPVRVARAKRAKKAVAATPTPAATE